MSQGAQRSSNDVLADRRFAYAQAAFAEGDAVAAADLAAQTLERAPDFVPALALLGKARAALGEREAALAPLRRALELEPEDVLGARITLAGLGALAPQDALTPAYIRTLFDDYAPRFDKHLIKNLDYRGPQLLADRLRRVLGRTGRPFGFRHGIDLGCGTGLMGVALEGACARLDGVDLSPRMLEKARKTRCYARLIEGDGTGFLAGEPAACADLVTAADVFCYVADLAPVLAASRRVLAKDGLLGFTVQALVDDGVQIQEREAVRLGEDGRFAHGEPYLRAAAEEAGFAVALFEAVSTRQDRGADVPGFLLVLAA